MTSDWCFHGPCAGCRSPFCRCGCHGEKPMVEGDSRSEGGKMKAQEKTAPGGALTPESQGLADYQGVD
jgi:hypothetical protein